MNKIWLIIQQEFLNRVKKKSFLIATILMPLIFPAIGGVMFYLAYEQAESAKTQRILVLDESLTFKADSSKYIFTPLNKPLEEGKKQLYEEDAFGLLYIPKFELDSPKGIVLFTKANPSPTEISKIETILENNIKDLKMKNLNLDQKLLDELKTTVAIQSIKISEGGIEKSSNTKVLFGLGMISGILIYMMIFIYGAQIMQSIIEEKMSKVIEVVISSVRPFQLMMGKIIGMTSVGLLQFSIWIIIFSIFSVVVTGVGGSAFAPSEMIDVNTTQQLEASEILRSISEISWSSILFYFLFYFIGGYLIYGSLFAAVGSAVDSPAEAQQFMFPISIPMMISYFALFTFILENPHGNISFWFSIIPFTSPIAMMGRIGFGVPTWQLVLSMFLLICGFLFTTWCAGRIYRVGILMHGTKVGYKVLIKWFMQKV